MMGTNKSLRKTLISVNFYLCTIDFLNIVRGSTGDHGQPVPPHSGDGPDRPHQSEAKALLTQRHIENSRDLIGCPRHELSSTQYVHLATQILFFKCELAYQQCFLR